MSKRWTACLVALLLLLAGAPGALAQAYSFPYAGVRLDAAEGWTVLTPETLAGQAQWLATMGASAQVLAADYAANHTVFEIYMPDGAQVALTAVQTDQTQGWGEAVYMAEAEREAFATAMDRAPHEQVAWSAAYPGYLQYTWTLQVGGMPVAFAAMTTVRQGQLYTLTACGATGTDTLWAACEAVLDRMEYLGAVAEGSAAAEQIAIPADITGEGGKTPMALVDFTGITYGDTTGITVRTLPGAEVTVQTPTDQLRNRADEEGLVKVQVSTRRETTYAYTVSAEAEGMGRSSMEITVQRRLDAAGQEAAYRRTARQLETIGYASLRDSAEASTGEAITFRGQVGGFADIGGFPGVLVYTNNPGRGVWTNPVWVLLTQAVALNMDDICTFYGDVRGDTLPYEGEEGTLAAPVIVGRSVVQ